MVIVYKVLRDVNQSNPLTLSRCEYYLNIQYWPNSTFLKTTEISIIAMLADDNISKCIDAPLLVKVSNAETKKPHHLPKINLALGGALIKPV